MLMEHRIKPFYSSLLEGFKLNKLQPYQDPHDHALSLRSKAHESHMPLLPIRGRDLLLLRGDTLQSRLPSGLKLKSYTSEDLPLERQMYCISESWMKLSYMQGHFEKADFLLCGKPSPANLPVTGKVSIRSPSSYTFKTYASVSWMSNKADTQAIIGLTSGSFLPWMGTQEVKSRYYLLPQLYFLPQ